MIPIYFIRRVCLVQRRVDFRMGAESLLGVSYRLGLTPYKGDLILFIRKDKRSIKILFADSTGLWLGTKYFHNGLVPKEFKFIEDPSVSQISPSTASKLMEGNKFKV